MNIFKGMFAMKRVSMFSAKKSVLWLLLLTAVLFVFVMNYYSVPGGDEICYAFAGENSWRIDNPIRVLSFMDIFKQQKLEYFVYPGNGRVLVHGIVAFFSGHQLYHFFDVLNTIVWFLLVYVLLKLSRVEVSLTNYLLEFVFIFWFFWYAEIACINGAFAVNYLWMALAFSAYLGWWERSNSPLLIPVALILGWTQEIFVLSFLGGACICGLIRFWLGERKICKIKIAAWSSMLLTACFLCFGPAARARAGTLGSNFIGGLLNAIVHLSCCITPVLLLALIIVIVVKSHAKLRDLVFRDLIWWCVLISGLCVFVLASHDGYLRTSAVWFLAAIVLIGRNRLVYSRLLTRVRSLLVMFVVIFIACCAIIQWRVGRASYRALEVYQSRHDGVTVMPAIARGPFYYSTADALSNGWYRRMYQLEYNHPQRMYILTPELYEEVKNDLSLSRAEILSKGNRCLNAHLHKNSGKRQFVPGRFSLMFPDAYCVMYENE